MSARKFAVALSVAGLMAAPSVASATSPERVASTPAVQAATAKAAFSLGDAAVAIGRIPTFDFAIAGYNTNGGASLAASGAFALVSRTTDLRLSGVVNCINANGNQAALGGEITQRSGGAQFGDAVAPGRNIEITVENTSGAPDGASLVFFRGAGTPANCGFFHEINSPLQPGIVSVFDR